MASVAKFHLRRRPLAAAIVLALLLASLLTFATRTTSARTPSSAAPPPRTEATPRSTAVVATTPPPTVAISATTTTGAPPSPPIEPSAPSDGRDAPDPFVLADGGGYWLYTTQTGLLNVPVSSSPDLATWSQPVDALPVLPSWVEWGRTWAPGVARFQERYVLFFAARHGRLGIQCIGTATAASPVGPFASTATDPLVCQRELGGSIDPHPFVDRDGSPYLLWKGDGNAIGAQSVLFASRLAADGLALDGEPAALLASRESWEDPLIENPALVAAAGMYVLFYSGGWWESSGYATGYAVCETPVGPCTRVTIDEPLLASDADEAGPGGACVLTGPAGEQWLVYHAWTPGAVGYGTGGVRSLRFAALSWSDAIPAVAR